MSFGSILARAIPQPYRDPSFAGGSDPNDPQQLALNNMFSSGKMDPSSFYGASPQTQAQQARQAWESAQAMGGLANNIASQQAQGRPTQAIDPSALMAGKDYLSAQASKAFAPIMNQMGPLSWLSPGQTAADPNANPMSWLSHPQRPPGTLTAGALGMPPQQGGMPPQQHPLTRGLLGIMGL